MKILIMILLTISLSANGQTAQEFYNKGNEKANDKNYAGSITDYDNAIKNDPKYTDAYFNRGSSKLYVKDFKSAIADFDKAIELRPDFLNAYTNRAIAKLKTDDTKGAIADFDVVLKMDPGNVSAYFMRGQGKLQDGDTKGGCTDLSKANDLGDTRAEKYLKQYCGGISSSKTEKVNESLKLDWPDAEGWRVASNQTDNGTKTIELLKNNETFENWTEIGTMIVNPLVPDVSVDLIMNGIHQQAKKTCPAAKLTFIEKDDKSKYPWIIFKIECEADKAESQVWQVMLGATEMYMNFRGVKQKSVPDNLKNKWVAFFKTAHIETQ